MGKIGVADAILQKPETLQPGGQAAMTEHVEIGHAILIAAELPVEADWVLHHHERYDGTGYPEGLRAAAIPIEARIIAVADAFEAMTGERPYRDSVTIEAAVEELQSYAGAQLDGRCVGALIEVVQESDAEKSLFAATSGSGLAQAPAVVTAPAFGHCLTG